MEAYFDKEKLSALIESVYRVTGININIYDKNLKGICTDFASPMCAFCKEVRRHCELSEGCRKSDEAALLKCRETKLRYSYRCHMGLIEVATPILYNDEILGFILFGQLAEGEDKSGIRYKAERAASDYSFEKEELLSALPAVRTVSRDYISSVSDIVKMAAEYIVMKRMLSYRNSIEKQLEAYICDNIKNAPSVDDICKKFGICATTLYNISIKSFGCGIKEYIGKCKIKLAKDMLSDNKSLKETAEELGFYDVNYFIRFFKSKTGVTPSFYKAAL